VIEQRHHEAWYPGTVLETSLRTQVQIVIVPELNRTRKNTKPFLVAKEDQQRPLTYKKMQALLSELDLPTLQLLQKVNSKVINSADEKFRTLKSSNETCQQKIFSVPKVMNILQLMGWTASPEGLVFNNESTKTLEVGLAAIEKAIEEKLTENDREYEERMAQAAARASQIQQKNVIEQQRKDAELKKIKAIQTDVRDRPVKASHADPTMGRSKEAIGIFAGAGGRSSSAKTFKDIGGSSE